MPWYGCYLLLLHLMVLCRVAEMGVNSAWMQDQWRVIFRHRQSWNFWKKEVQNLKLTRLFRPILSNTKHIFLCSFTLKQKRNILTTGFALPISPFRFFSTVTCNQADKITFHHSKMVKSMRIAKPAYSFYQDRLPLLRVGFVYKSSSYGRLM